MSGDPLSVFPVVLEFRAFVRRPRLLQSGNMIQFFVEFDSPFHDAALVLAQRKFLDAEVGVKVYLLKHPDGRSAAGEVHETDSD